MNQNNTISSVLSPDLKGLSEVMTDGDTQGLSSIIESAVTKRIDYPSPAQVSIIVPAYNRAPFLTETIDSILDQDYPNVEIIVLDDGSTDNTQDVLKRYDGRIYSLRHENMGENRTVNRGLEECSGAIICVVNSDDPLLPGAISAAVEYLDDHPAVLAAYPDWIEIDVEGNRLNTYVLPQYDIHNMLLSFEVAMGPGVFFRRRALEMIGMRNASLRYTGDLDYWFRLSLRGPLGHIPLVLATHRTHPGAASSSAKGRVMANELVRLVDTVFMSGYLPPDLHQRRHRIYSFAHAVALSYLGDNRQGAWRHRLIGLYHAARSPESEASSVWTPEAYEWFRVRLSLLRRWVHLKAEALKRFFLLRFARLAGWLLRTLWCAFHVLSPAPVFSKHHRYAFINSDLFLNGSARVVMIKRLLAHIPRDNYVFITQRHDCGELASAPSSQWVPMPAEPGERLWLRGDALGAASVLMRVILRGWRIADHLRAHGCKVVLAAPGDLIDLPAAAVACTLSRIPMAVYLFDDYLSLWDLPPKVLSVILTMEKVLFAKASSVIVPNEGLADAIRRRHGVTCSVIRNPRAESMIIQTARISGAMHGETSAPLIVSIGAINHLNLAAYRTLVAAIGLISGESPRLEIYMDNDPAQLESEGLSIPGVQLRPHLKPEAHACTLRGADVLFIGYTFDPWVRGVVNTSSPGELGDYLASGRPLLAMVPPESFLARYLTDNHCALVVDEDDPEAVANGLQRLLHEQGLATDLVAHALERARAEFAPEVSARRLHLVLDGAR